MLGSFNREKQQREFADMKHAHTRGRAEKRETQKRAGVGSRERTKGGFKRPVGERQGE